MTLHVHHLGGCAPVPLAHYLKALGILRLVSTQRDETARGFWTDEHFCLVTTLDREALVRFFLDEYAPTPFVSPWNRGSGFFASTDPALDPVEHSTALRFAAYRAGIAAARKPLASITAADAEVRRLKDQTKAGKKGLTNAEKARATALKSDPDFKARLSAAEREFKRLKADLYAPFAAEWRGLHREWLDAAMVLSETGKPTWAWLLGTGGSDGRLDFTNNAMQRLAELFDLPSKQGATTALARPLLLNALFGAATQQMQPAAIGQFLPGTAGGANGSTGPEAEAQVNPWDFVLMLEGAVLFRGQATRRLDTQRPGQAAVPFAVHAHAVGHATRGREKTERGEQWMPLWTRAASLGDIVALFGEGRAQLGRATAQRPLDFARAVARLGTARGVAAFERYGYLERNGQSKIAVPLGRIECGESPRARLLDEIAPWQDRLQRLVRDGDAPTRLAVVEGNLADAAFAAVTRDDGPQRWQAVLIGAAELEQIQAAGTAFQAGPLPALSGGWLEAAAEDSPEWRLAVALGSAAGEYAYGRPLDPVRAHALPLEKGRYATTPEKRLRRDPRVVLHGRDPIADLIALVERRIVEAGQTAKRHLPLVAARGLGAQPGDLAELLLGRVDLERVLLLARALMAVRWKDVAGWRHVRPRAPSRSQLDEAWVALRLCGLPFDVHERRIALDAALVRRLAAGDAPAAVGLALRRLSASGFRPPLVGGTADAATARRWAAALAFPIDPAVANAMADRFQTHATTETP